MQLHKYLYVSVRVRVCACECGQLFVHGCVWVYVQEHVVRERERVIALQKQSILNFKHQLHAINQTL